MREEILKKINEIIVSEHGEELKEDDLLINSQMDSFAYAIFWLSIDEEFKLFEDELESSKESNKRLHNFINNIDYKTYKVGDLISRIEKCL